MNVQMWTTTSTKEKAPDSIVAAEFDAKMYQKKDVTHTHTDSRNRE